MAIVNNVPSPPDMDSSKYEPDLNKPKKPMPKPKPKPKPKKAELFDVEEEVVTAKRGGMMYSKGGSASSLADGCAKRGKTRGKMI